MYLTRKNFLGGLMAGAGLVGCRSIGFFSEVPRLTFGVVSDLHVTTPESTAVFRRALRYFRRRGADAVMVPGDLSDWGLRSGLMAVADAWREEMSGSSAVPLFCTGNHDAEGWWYGDMTLDMHLQGYSEDEALSRLGMAKCWQEAFGERYDEIRCRMVKGYRFVSVEWDGREKSGNDAKTADWLKAHAAELGGEKPFFFFRHAPLAGTVSSSVGRSSDMTLTTALSAFPNAVAFTGHTHWTLNDERSIWQGDFTAVSVPSMSYTSIPKGYENGSAPRNGTSALGMARLPSRDDLKEAQGCFVSVYADRIVIERYDFSEMIEAADAWVVPLGAAAGNPYTFETHARRVPVPQFPSDAAVKAYTTNADRRDGRWTIFMTLEFPSAYADGGRVFDYEVSAVSERGEVLVTKRFLSPGFYKTERFEPARQSFRFDGMDLPERGRYRFCVTARNCFGAASCPIWSRSFESIPGKDKTKYRSWE